MKVNAYRCDVCFKIRLSKHIVGITPIVDMFDKLKSYPEIKNLDKTTVHYCISCYSDKVIIPSSTINRKKNEEFYKQQLKELSFSLRQSAVQNHAQKIFKESDD